jgi:hypothetical protein
MNPLHPLLLAAYASRHIQPGNVHVLAREVDHRPSDVEELTRAHAALYTPELEQRVARLQELRQDRDVLMMYHRQHEAGEIDSFRYAGQRYASDEARRLLQWLDGQLDAEERWWADFDRRVFVVHYQMARDLGEAEGDDLRSRYLFQLALQEVEGETSRKRRVVSRVASYVNDSSGAVDYGDFADVRDELMEAYDVFERCLRGACRLKPPKLPCLPAGQPLANILLSEAPVKRLKPVAQTVSGRWIHKLGKQLDEVRDNARRVQAESLSALLARQAWVARRWAEEATTMPEVEEAVEEEEETPERRTAREALLQPLDAEGLEVSEEDVVDAEAVPDKTGAELEQEVDAEFALSDQDVLPGPEEAGPDVELEDLDPKDHTKRRRHWNL